jgi:hypothetical protein
MMFELIGPRETPLDYITMVQIDTLIHHQVF